MTTTMTTTTITTTSRRRILWFALTVVLLLFVTSSIIQATAVIMALSSLVDRVDSDKTNAISLFQAEAALSSLPVIDENNNNNNNNNNTSSNNASTPKSPRFAVVFLVAGCDPFMPAHRGFLHNVVIAAYILREAKTIDVHVMIRLSATTNATKLDDDEEAFLHHANVMIRYLPKVEIDTFYTAMMAKFAVLDYTEYDRVLCMDADALPLCNLEYLLLASYEGKLKSNVVLSWFKEPASGGFFILKPGKKERLDEIVDTQRRRQQDKNEMFDETWGWGQELYLPWYSTRHNGTDWKFYGADSDQGLLHQWTLYEQQDVTQISPFGLRHYGTRDGKAYMESEEPLTLGGCYKPSMVYLERRFPQGITTFSDFYHFSGNYKPWKANVTMETLQLQRTRAGEWENHPEEWKDTSKHPLRDPAIYWQVMRLMVAEETNTTFPEVGLDNKPPLGGVPKPIRMPEYQPKRRRRQQPVVATEKVATQKSGQ